MIFGDFAIFYGTFIYTTTLKMFELMLSALNFLLNVKNCKLKKLKLFFFVINANKY